MKTKSRKTKILVTGVTGQLGEEIFSSLNQNHYEIIGTALKEEALISDSVEPLDLSSEEDIRSTVRLFAPDIIINCAAYTAVDKAEEDIKLSLAVNSLAPAILAEEAKAFGALFIHVSTDYVFNGEGDHAHKEEESTDPINQYGSSKLKGEEKIRSIGGSYAILRTSWVYSADGNNFLKTMVKLGLVREQLNVVSDQIGAPTSTLELKKAIKAVMNRYLEKPESFAKNFSGLYHTTCSGETSWYGFAKQIFLNCEKKGLNLKIKELKGIPSSEYPTPAKRPLNSRLDCRKFEKCFGLRFEPWEKALDNVMENFSLEK